MARTTKLKYDTADANGWREKADDLFLAQFRGRPCQMCGKTHGDSGKGIIARSCGHHGIEKDMCRAHRYNADIIITLCPEHHSRFNGQVSPHSKNPVKQGIWWEWLMNYNPSQYEYIKEHHEDKFDGSWSYRDMYIALGGEVESKTGNKKDLKPVNHGKNIERIESSHPSS